MRLMEFPSDARELDGDGFVRQQCERDAVGQPEVFELGAFRERAAAVDAVSFERVKIELPAEELTCWARPLRPVVLSHF
ncbi:MAG: hypothetical protein U5K38_05665 [Woeseiaceae bacterium]|nr:hypothetical protein [Woeseiaceae bacterium]